jgi:tripartite-type tricarboxylate transporter receptor subunit TctC
VSWHLIVAPAKTPRPIVDKLNAEIKAVTALPELHSQMLKMGLMPVATPSVDELKKFMAAENKRWGTIVREAGVAGAM